MLAVTLQPLNSWNVSRNHRAQREHYTGSSTQGESAYTTRAAVYMCVGNCLSAYSHTSPNM